MELDNLLPYLGTIKLPTTDAELYAERILQDCMFGGLLKNGFWSMIFQSEKILKMRKVPLSIRQETLEIMRRNIVDDELCGDFDRQFECEKCKRSFVPDLSKKYVMATLPTKQVLCGKCCTECIEISGGSEYVK